MSQLQRKFSRRKAETRKRVRKHRLSDQSGWRLEDRTVPTLFSNTASITLNDSGDATPFPSTINVSGLTGQVITDLNVRLNGFGHAKPEDIDVMLIAPDGTHIYLMSDTGGGAPGVTGINLIFDGSAADSLTTAPFVSGTYLPTNIDQGDPDTITGAPATPAVTTLAGFQGVNPNGIWELRITADNPFGGGGAITGGWTLDITSRVNSAPVANPDSAYTVVEEGSLTVTAAGNPAGVLANDTDADGDPLTAQLVTTTSHGTLTFNANGDGGFSYQPIPNFAGQDTFTYRAYDGVVVGNTTTVTITVTNVSDPPTAVPDNYTVQNGGPQTVHSAIGVLSNDIDPDGAQAGDLVFANFENFALQPWTTAPGLTGADGGDGTDWSPDLPFGWARDNAATPTTPKTGRLFTPELYGWHVLDSNSWIGDQTDQGRSTFALGGAGSHGQILVVDGDAYEDNVETDPDLMDAIFTTNAIPIGGVVNGSLKLDFDNSFRPEYDGNPNGSIGRLEVSYDGGTTWSQLLQYDSTNTPNGDLIHANEHLTFDLNPTPGAATVKFKFSYLDAGNDWWWGIDNLRVSGNRTDISTLTATMATNVPAAAGSVTLNPNGSFVYNPASGFTGATSFTYTLSDGTTTTSPVTVNLTVNANTVAPVGAVDAYSTLQGQALNVGYSDGVLTNDSDADVGGTNVGLRAIVVTPPTAAQGTLALNADGSFLFTPNPSFFGAASFTYKVNDGVNETAPLTVAITVIQNNLAPPVANDDSSYTVTQNSALNVAAPGVLGNDTDADNNPLTAQLVLGPSHGTLTLNSDGSFAYTPIPFYYGADTFTYRAADFNFTSNVATVTITVNQANVAPLGNPDAYTTGFNTPLTTTAATGVLRNDQDDGPIVQLFATETFESLAPLGPFVSPTESGGDGTDWTATLPAGWTRDNTTTPIGNPVEFQGWNALDADSWVATEGGQSRERFTRGGVGAHGTVFVADGDAYDDGTTLGGPNMITYLQMPSIALGSIQQNSLQLEFDSSYRPEDPQAGSVEVSYDGGTNWTSILTLDAATSGGNGSNSRTNEHLTLDAFNPTGAASASFRFKYVGGNNWWWAIDNVRATGRNANAGANMTAINFTQPAHGALVPNANGSFTYTPTTGYRGFDSFTYQPRDGANTGNVTTVSLLVGSQAGVQVDDGTAQRSMVRTATVYFAGTPTFAGAPEAAFTLTNAASAPVTFTVTTVEAAGALTKVTLGNFTGAQAENGSLKDGRYTLTALSSQITIGGAALDGDNDGAPGGDSVTQFHRFYGDVDGNARDDISDFGPFSLAFLQGPAANNQYFDFNLDGRIDISDFGQFSVRYFTSLP